jgi:hypothetical protein
MTKQRNIVSETEQYLNSYLIFPEDYYSLPIALWTIGTHLWPNFDSFPYMVITSETKRSGKSTLKEMVSFASANPRNFTAATPAVVFKIMDEEKPTVFIDEAEQSLTSENSPFRPILNSGYRRGDKVPRIGKDGVKEYEVYGPKCFILIGDVFDTLRDRSIVISMKRSNQRPPKNFRYDTAKADGEEIRERISIQAEENMSKIIAEYGVFDYRTLDFLTSARDAEIWTALFCICKVFAPERIEELKRSCVDMSMEKTGEKKSFADLADAEEKANRAEMSERLVRDLASLCGKDKGIASAEAVDKLKAIPTAPWRKYKGHGITMIEVSYLLDVFGIQPKVIRRDKTNGRKSKSGDGSTYRGYTRESLHGAMKVING